MFAKLSRTVSEQKNRNVCYTCTPLQHRSPEPEKKSEWKQGDGLSGDRAAHQRLRIRRHTRAKRQICEFYWKTIGWTDKRAIKWGVWFADLPTICSQPQDQCMCSKCISDYFLKIIFCVVGCAGARCPIPSLAWWSVIDRVHCKLWTFLFATGSIRRYHHCVRYFTINDDTPTAHILRFISISLLCISSLHARQKIL